MKKYPASLLGAIATCLIILFFIGCPAPNEDNQTSPPTPEINIKQGATDLVNGSGSYDFGSISADVDGGAASNYVTFTIENTGNADLTISSLTLAGSDFDKTNPLSTTVAAGGSTTFTIRFDPLTVGNKSAGVNILNNDASESSYAFTVTGTGTVAAPEINVKQGTTDLMSGSGTYDLGSVAVDGDGNTASSYVIFTIENTGLVDLTISSLTISGSEFDKTDPVSTTISAAGTTTFTVRFDPLTAGIRSATVTINSNDSDEAAYTFAVTGTGTGPEINVKQNLTNLASGSGTYDFGSMSADGDGPAASSYLTFTIENLGNTNLTISSLTITGSDFDKTNPVSTTIAGSTSTTFTIRFDPLTPGIKSATVTINNNDNDEPVYTFSVTGTGTNAPEINVKQGTTNIVAGTGSYDFGDMQIGGGEVSVVFTIENLGLADLLLRTDVGTNPSIMNTGLGFSVTVPPAITTIVPSGNTTFTIRFRPVSIGLKSTTITLYSYEGDEGDYSFTITGNAINPEMNVKQNTTSIVDGTGSYSFGNVKQKAVSSKVFTIENLGTTNLNLTGGTKVSVTGTDFTVSAQPSSPVASSGTTTFTITLNTTTIGSKSTTVSIANNDLNENPYDFTITATVVEWYGTQTISDAGSTNYGTNSSIYRRASEIYICYLDSTNKDLKFVKSTDAGATWNTPLTIDSTGDVGYDCSITVVIGTIFVSYYDSTNGNLKFAKSTDLGATWPAGNIKTVDSTGVVGLASSLAAWGDQVFISYYDTTNTDIKGALSLDAGATWPTVVTIAGASTNVGSQSAVVINAYNHKVYLAYYDSSNTDVRFARSTDEGATWEATNDKVVDSTGTVGTHLSISDDGSTDVNPSYIYISYFDSTNGDLKFAKSTDQGATWPAGSIKVVDNTSTTVGEFNAMVAGGTTVYVSYYNGTNGDLKFACSTDAGTNWTLTTVDSAGNVGYSCTSINANNSTIQISYYDVSLTSLKFAKSTDGGVTW